MLMLLTAVMGVAAARTAQILWVGRDPEVRRPARPSLRRLSSL